MAENRNRMSNAQQEIERLRKQQEEEMKRNELQAQREQFDEGLNRLADLAVEYQTTRQDDSITDLLTTFLDVALEMQEMMQTVEAVNLAMQCVNEAINFLDTANKMDEDMITATMETKYNVFTYWKQKIRNQQAIRNHRNRIRNFANNLGMKFDMARGMVDAMQDFAKSLNRTAKRQKKKGGGAGPSSRAQAFMAERAKARGVQAPTFEGGGAPQGGAPAASGSGDYSDIFH